MMFFTETFHLLAEQSNVYYQQHLDKLDLAADYLTLRCQTCVRLWERCVCVCVCVCAHTHTHTHTVPTHTQTQYPHTYPPTHTHTQYPHTHTQYPSPPTHTHY